MSQRQKEAELRETDVQFRIAEYGDSRFKSQKTGRFEKRPCYMFGDEMKFEVKFKKGRLPIRASIFILGKYTPDDSPELTFFEQEVPIVEILSEFKLNSTVPDMHIHSYEAEDCSVRYAATLICYSETSEIEVSSRFEYCAGKRETYNVPGFESCELANMLVSNVVLARTGIVTLVVSPQQLECDKIAAALRISRGKNVKAINLGVVCYKLRTSITINIPLESFSLQPTVDFYKAETHTFLTVSLQNGAVTDNVALELFLY